MKKQNCHVTDRPTNTINIVNWDFFIKRAHLTLTQNKEKEKKNPLSHLLKQKKKELTLSPPQTVNK
jgi:hypothetical protein